MSLYTTTDSGDAMDLHVPMNTDLEAFAGELTKLNDKYKKYTRLGEGSYRTTYDLGNAKVAKVPCVSSVTCGSNTGVSANLIEYEIYKKYSRSRIFAKAELIWKLGFPVLIMDKVESHQPTDAYSKRIKKNDLDFDDGYYQCGKNSKGHIVCYDYGNEFDFLTPSELKKVESVYMEIYKKFSKKALTAA